LTATNKLIKKLLSEAIRLNMEERAVGEEEEEWEEKRDDEDEDWGEWE